MDLLDTKLFVNVYIQESPAYNVVSNADFQ